MQYKHVVRVAVHNNFNCTAREYKQLDTFQATHPDLFFFTNTNINTPALKNIREHPYKSMITLNPNLYVLEKEVRNLFKIDPRRVGFVRIKVLPNEEDIIKLIERMSAIGYNVVLTLQRFNGLKNLNKYSSREEYTWIHSRFRLNEKPLKKIVAIANKNKNVFICDKKGEGCQGCGLCAKLTVGEDLPIKTLNLSTSGPCKFSCPDCYAKTAQNRLKTCDNPHICFDKIYLNSKQAGKTAHIQMMVQQKLSSVKV